MLWVNTYKVDIPDYFADFCKDYTEKNDPIPAGVYESVSDSSMWTVWSTNEKCRLRLVEIREIIKNITGANLEYPKGFLCIWRYDENFTKCPIHIDGQGAYDGDKAPRKHNGSVCTSIHGEFKIHLHHKETNEILDTVTVTESDLIALNNTVYPHSVEGHGDLAVFGIDLQHHPKEFFAGEAPDAGL